MSIKRGAFEAVELPPIHLMAKHSFLRFLREQLARPVPLVTEDLTGKVVLVTGGNIGLGFEAAKHFASMNPEMLIIACRSEVKGKQAVKGLFSLAHSAMETGTDAFQ